jgi:hypothetical protein
LTGTPVTIDQIRLLAAENNQEVGHWDGDAKRMDGFGSVDVNLKLPLNYVAQPEWRGIINITTIRGGSFNSNPFQWGVGVIPS